MLRTRVLNGPGLFEEFREPWQNLFSASNTTPFQSYEWQSLWFKHYGRTKQPRLVTVYEGDDLVGLMPFTRTHIPWRTLRPMGVGPSDYLHPLSLPGQEESVAQAITDYLRSVKDADLVDLQQVRETLPFASSAPSAQIIDQATCLVLDLPETYDAFLAMLGKSLRYDVRKLDKTAFKEGRASVQQFTPEDVQTGMDIFFDLHSRRWKKRGQFWGGAFMGRSVQFHRAWAEEASRNGWLWLSVLRWDDQPIGAIYAMNSGDTTFFYQSGFDPTMSAVSPGTLLVAYTIRRSIEEGKKHFDFMRGDEPYKRRWKPQHVLKNHRFLFPTHGGLGKLGSAWNEMGSRVEKQVRAKLEGKGLI